MTPVDSAPPEPRSGLAAAQAPVSLVVWLRKLLRSFFHALLAALNGQPILNPAS